MKASAWMTVAFVGLGLAAASPTLAQSRHGSGSYGYDYETRVSPDRDRYDSRYGPRSFKCTLYDDGRIKVKTKRLRRY